MTRPARITVNSGDNAWETELNTNLQQLYDRPFPPLLHAGDLADLESTRPAAQFQYCFAVCDYDSAGTPGQHLAFSNGTAWKLASNWEMLNRRTMRSISGADSAADADDVILTTGGSSFALTLPAISDANEGREITHKHIGTGTITVTPTGGDTIDGAATHVVATENTSLIFVSDGTGDWMVMSAGAGATSVLELSDAPSSYSSQSLKLLRVNVGETAVEFVTPSPIPLIVAVGDEITAITTGLAKVTFRMPYAFTVTEVRASLTTVSSSGIPTIDINESGSTILSTKLTIDVSELTSTTAVTPAVISDAALADDAEITIDIDVSGTGAAGLKITLIGDKA